MRSGASKDLNHSRVVNGCAPCGIRRVSASTFDPEIVPPRRTTRGPMFRRLKGQLFRPWCLSTGTQIHTPLVYYYLDLYCMQSSGRRFLQADSCERGAACSVFQLLSPHPHLLAPPALLIARCTGGGNMKACSTLHTLQSLLRAFGAIRTLYYRARIFLHAVPSLSPHGPKLRDAVRTCDGLCSSAVD